MALNCRILFVVFLLPSFFFFALPLFLVRLDVLVYSMAFYFVFIIFVFFFLLSYMFCFSYIPICFVFAICFVLAATLATFITLAQKSTQKRERGEKE